MGTVKLNNDVRTSVRGELGSSPRILLWTTQNRPILPQFPDWGSGIFWGSGMSGVFFWGSGVSPQRGVAFSWSEWRFRRREWRYGRVNATPQNPCAARKSGISGMSGVLFGALSALPDPVTRPFSGFVTRSST